VDELKAELRAGLDDLAREAAGRARPAGAAATLRRARQRRRRRTQGAALLTVAVAGALVLAGQRLGDLGGGGTTVVPVAPVTSTRPVPPWPVAPVLPPVTTTTRPGPSPTTRPGDQGATGTTRAGDGGPAGAGSGSGTAEPGPGALASGRKAGRTWRLVVVTGPDSTPPGGASGPVPPGPVPPGPVAPVPPSAPVPGASACLNLEWSGPVLVAFGCRPAGDERLTAAEATGEVPARALGGWVPSGATAVRVELRGRAPVRAAAVAGRAWVAFPPEGATVTGVAAYDRDGRLLARTASVSRVPGPPGVVPSPLP
jgi:hypothetical protein